MARNKNRNRTAAPQAASKAPVAAETKPAETKTAVEVAMEKSAPAPQAPVKVATKVDKGDQIAETKPVKVETKVNEAPAAKREPMKPEVSSDLQRATHNPPRVANNLRDQLVGFRHENGQMIFCGMDLNFGTEDAPDGFKLVRLMKMGLNQHVKGTFVRLKNTNADNRLHILTNILSMTYFNVNEIISMEDRQPELFGYDCTPLPTAVLNECEGYDFPTATEAVEEFLNENEDEAVDETPDNVVEMPATTVEPEKASEETETPVVENAEAEAGTQEPDESVDTEATTVSEDSTEATAEEGKEAAPAETKTEAATS